MCTGTELQLVEQLLHLVGVHNAEGEVLDIGAEIKITHESVDPPIEPDLLDVVPQSLALLARDLPGVLDDARQGPVLVDPFGGVAVADARDPGDVVGRLTPQRREIGILAGVHPVLLLDGLRGHVFEVLEMVARVQHGHAVIHQLEGVPVPRQHQRAVSRTLPHRRHGADDVITLVPRHFDIGDAQGRQQSLDERQLGQQILRRGVSRALVLRQHGVAKRAALHVEGHGEMIRRLGIDDLGEHGDETPYRIGGLAGGRGKVLDRQCEERTECQGMSVYDEQRALVPLGTAGCGTNAHLSLRAPDRRTWR